MSRITALYCKNNFFTGEDGNWVRNSTRRGNNIKSFGAYNCSCNKIWSSARSISNVKQYCHNCGLGCFPLFIWKNTLNKKRIINNGFGNNGFGNNGFGNNGLGNNGLGNNGLGNNGLGNNGLGNNGLGNNGLGNNGLGNICICENKKSKPFFPITCCYIIFIFIIIIVILEYIITVKDSNLLY